MSIYLFTLLTLTFTVVNIYKNACKNNDFKLKHVSLFWKLCTSELAQSELPVISFQNS